MNKKTFLKADKEEKCFILKFGSFSKRNEGWLKDFAHYIVKSQRHFF